MRIMTEDEFYEKFHPNQNHLTRDAPFDGCMFETYGQDLNYINNLRLDKNTYKYIWTILEIEGKYYISSGYHFVNRIGYFVTDEEWDEDIEVKLDEEE